MLKIIKEDNAEALASMYDYDNDMDTEFDKDMEDDIGTGSIGNTKPDTDSSGTDSTSNIPEDEIDDSDIVDVSGTEDTQDNTDEDTDDSEILNENTKDDLKLIAKELVNSTDKATIRTNINYLKILDKDLYKNAMKLLKAGRSLTYVAKVVSDTIIQSNESICNESTDNEGTAYLITYGYDDGDAENGPCWGSGTDIIYANSEEEACKNWEDQYARQIGHYEGCWAREATPEEIKYWEDEMEELAKWEAGMIDMDDMYGIDEATNPGSIGHFKRTTIGDKDLCPECGLADCICDECDSIIKESYTDMSGSDQYAAERAIEIYKNDDISIEDAVSRACAYVSDANAESDYEDEDFYQEEADYNTVLRYVKNKLGLTEEDEFDVVEEDIDDFDLDEEETASEWEFVESKSVLDSDGCSTDYTLYHNPSTGQYICMFGDVELYDPDPMYADFETDSEDEAREWFDSYEGIIEDNLDDSDTDDFYFENKKVEESHDKWLDKAKKSGHSFMNLVESYQKSTGITVPKEINTREDKVIVAHFKKWCESNMF